MTGQSVLTRASLPFSKGLYRMPFASRGGLFRGYHIAAAAICSLILLQAILAYVLGSRAFHIGWGDVFALFQKGRTVAIWLLIPLLWIGAVTIAITRRQIDRPTRTLLRWTRFRADWLIRGLIIITAYPTMANSFSIIKATIPYTVGFYADPYFIEMDKLLLFGREAWQITHAIFPYSLTFAIDRIYVVWFSYMALLTGVFGFTHDVRFQMRAALTFFLGWVILGIGVATALASVGPIFYDPVYRSDHFAGLMDILHRADAEQKLVAILTMEFLVKNAGTPTLGVGISAMPSMHVSVSVLGFLMSLHYSGKLWLKAFTFIFTTFIVIGSVHLGWHYLVDGIASIIGTVLIWIAAGRFVDWTYRPSESALTR